MPMNAQYIAQSMGLQVYCTKEDLFAVNLATISFTAWFLLSGSSRRLELFHRRVAASIESSWPRKKDKKETLLLLKAFNLHAASHIEVTRAQVQVRYIVIFLSCYYKGL